MLVGQALVLWWTGLYRGLWRFASLPDLWNIPAPVHSARSRSAGLVPVQSRLEGVPRSSCCCIPLTCCCSSAVAHAVPILEDSRYGRRDRSPALPCSCSVRGGQRGVVRELRRENRFRPVDSSTQSFVLGGKCMACRWSRARTPAVPRREVAPNAADRDAEHQQQRCSAWWRCARRAACRSRRAAPAGCGRSAIQLQSLKEVAMRICLGATRCRSTDRAIARTRRSACAGVRGGAIDRVGLCRQMRGWVWSRCASSSCRIQPLPHRA